VTNESLILECEKSGGLQIDVVFLGCPIAPSYMRPNWGGGGGCRVSANEDSVHLYTGAQINLGDLKKHRLSLLF
jgi:hypothetical protein